MNSDNERYKQLQKKFEVDYEPILINGIEIPKTTEVILEARRRLWYMSDLYWKLDSCQEKIYDFLSNKAEKTLVVVCSRRLGKSYLLTVKAVEFCLSNPNSIVKMLQPQQNMIRMNITPIVDKIFRDCPESLRPEFSTKDNVYKFPNGSQIQLAGTDNKSYNKLRGSDCHLAIIDEAGFCSDLKHIINSILIPSTTLTRGKIILSSTPPTTPEHEFFKYIEAAEYHGTLIRKTIYDAIEDHKMDEVPRITAELIADIIKGIPGGENSDEFRTEYLCQKVFNSDSSIVPNFVDVEFDIVREWPKPQFYDSYVSMDVGVKDLTGVLFAYYDFENAIVYIEDEFTINGPKMTTQLLAEMIEQKERDLWFNHSIGEQREPYKRVSDHNKLLIQDLMRLHDIYFEPVKKDSLINMVNNMRVAVQNYEVYINPRCKQLISHLKNGTWKPDRKEFARSADNGHYDLLASLMYLLISIEKNRNPFPKNHRWASRGMVASNSFFKNGDPDEKRGIDRLASLYATKSSLHSKNKKFNK